jgi:hypothetical protein
MPPPVPPPVTLPAPVPPLLPPPGTSGGQASAAAAALVAAALVPAAQQPGPEAAGGRGPSSAAAPAAAPGSPAAPASPAAGGPKAPNPFVVLNNWLTQQKPPAKLQLEEGQASVGSFRASYYVAGALVAQAEAANRALAKGKAALLACAQLQVDYDFEAFISQARRDPRPSQPFGAMESRTELLRFWRRAKRAASKPQGKKQQQQQKQQHQKQQQQQQQQQQQLAAVLQSLPLPVGFGLLAEHGGAQEGPGQREAPEQGQQGQRRLVAPASTCPVTALHNHAQSAKLPLQFLAEQGQGNSTRCTWLLADQPIGCASHLKPKLAKSMSALAALQQLQIDYDYEAYMAIHKVPKGPVLVFWKQLQGAGGGAPAAGAQAGAKRKHELAAQQQQQQQQQQQERGSSEPDSPDARPQQRQRKYDWRESMAAAALAATAAAPQEDKAGQAYLAQLAAALDSDEEEEEQAQAGGAGGGGQQAHAADAGGAAAHEESDVEEGELPE